MRTKTRKAIAILMLVGALVGIVAAAGAQPSDTYVKDNGVTIIRGDVLAPAGTPDGMVSYVAAQAGR